MNDNCEHNITELRYMVHCKQYRKQCLSCFQSVGDAIAKRTIAPDQIESIPPFDIVSRDDYWKTKSAQMTSLAQQIATDAKNKLAERRAFYESYLQSADWREKRLMVIRRESGLCQGCRKEQITQVHHRNYDRLGDELLTDLYGYCETCHKKSHGLI